METEALSRSEQSRSQIMDAARRLFVKNGFHGTSMRQIAREAGIALGGIYNHFASKEELFVAVLEAYHPYREILPFLEQAQEKTVEGFVYATAENMKAVLDRRPDFLNLMMIEIVEFNSRHVPQLFQLIFPQIARVVRTFMARKENLRPIPVPMIMRIFLGLFFSYYLTEKLIGQDFPQELQEGDLDYFLEVFLHGILIDGGAAAEGGPGD